MAAKITILAVDDQPIILSAMQMLIENEDDLSVAGTATDGEAAVEAAKTLKPDLVFMDINMPGINGIEATRQIVSENPDTKVVVLTVLSTLEYVVPALQAGASGYLVKDSETHEILDAIWSALGGNLPLSPKVVQLLAQRVIGEPQDSDAAGSAGMKVGLAPREISVLQLLGRGMSNREIAQEMYTSEGSVKAYLANACTKLGVRDRLQAVIRGFELGIISPRLVADR